MTSMPYSGVTFCTAVRMACEIPSRPRRTSFFSSARISSATSSSTSPFGGSQAELRTSSASGLAATWSRTIESMMSPRRDWAPPSAATLLRKFKGTKKPQRGRVSPQENPPPRRGDLVRSAVPNEETLIKAANFLNKRDFEVKTGFSRRGAHGPAELQNDRLLAFLQHVEGAKSRKQHQGDQNCQRSSHRARHGFFSSFNGFFSSFSGGGTPPESKASHGTKAFCSLSTM